MEGEEVLSTKHASGSPKKPRKGRTSVPSGNKDKGDVLKAHLPSTLLVAESLPSGRDTADSGSH